MHRSLLTAFALLLLPLTPHIPAPQSLGPGVCPSAAAQQLRSITEERITPLLPPESVRASGHPKLVALLVAEDYAAPPPSGSWPHGVKPLPGVWQDLARMKRRLEKLGFGKIMELAADRAAGSTRTVPLVAIA